MTLFFFRNIVKPGLSSAQDDPRLKPHSMHLSKPTPIRWNLIGIWIFIRIISFVYCVFCAKRNVVKNMLLFFIPKSKANFAYIFAKLHRKFTARVNTYTNLNCISIKQRRIWNNELKSGEKKLSSTKTKSSNGQQRQAHTNQLAKEIYYLPINWMEVLLNCFRIKTLTVSLYRTGCIIRIVEKKCLSKRRKCIRTNRNEKKCVWNDRIIRYHDYMISFIENGIDWSKYKHQHTEQAQLTLLSSPSSAFGRARKRYFENLHFTFDRRQSKSHSHLIELNNNTANENTKKKRNSLDFVDFHNSQRLDVSFVSSFFSLSLSLFLFSNLLFLSFSRVCVSECVCLYESLLKLFCWIILWDASIDARRFVCHTWIGIFVEFDSLFEFFHFLHRSDNVWLFDNGTDMIVMSGAVAVALLFASFT